MAVSCFLLAPTILADETGKPASVPKNDASANSVPTAGALEKPKAAGRKLLPTRTASSEGAPASEGMGRHAARRGTRQREHDNVTPKVELFLGYSYWRAVPNSTGNRIDALHGDSTSLAYNLNSHLGIVFDFGGFRDDSLKFNSPGAGFSPSRVVDTDGNVFTYLVGPRISFRHHERLTPFLQVLGGAVHASEVTVDGCIGTILACKPLLSETVFAMTAGGGLDLRLSHHVALRLFQAEYLLTRFEDPTSATLAGKIT
jgi:hypothetical protein